MVNNSETAMSAAQTALAASMITAARHGHRALVVLSGTAAACRAVAGCWFTEAQPAAVWLGESVPGGVAPARALALLGTECALAVVDTHEGLHPDALAAVAGTVVAGGALVLLTPPWPQWSSQADADYERLASYPHTWQGLPARFLAHIQRLLVASPACLHVPLSEVAEPFPWPHAWPVIAADQAVQAPTPAQAASLLALQTHQGVSVLMAPRGRGKSSLLGFAARHWLAQGQRVLLVAPAKRSAANVFRQAGSGLVFAAPDQLLQDRSMDADVLLIDEASAIPLPMLQSLLQRFPKAVLATTTDGYEGTGQGFVLRFLRELDVLAPGWQRLTLDSPVRWAEGDPLERWLYDALLLDAAEAALTENADAASAIFEKPTFETMSFERMSFETLTQQQLADDPVLLREVYGLLRSAHYRSTPDDLRFLLDAPCLSLYRLCLHGRTVAVALLVEEGSLDEVMVAEIAAGRRRPRGHLLVQTLAVHEQQPQFLQQRVARVVRIAVHTQLQGQRLGSRLLQAVVTDQRARGVQAVGSSFSATPEVLAFWQKNGFSLIRVGHKRQKASAAPSALVLRSM